MDLSTAASLHENNRLEVKAAKGGLPKSLWESISAFANTSGGVILLGVSERPDGSFDVTGLSDPNKMLDDFWHSASNPDKLSPCVVANDDAYVQDIDGGDVPCDAGIATEASVGDLNAASISSYREAYDASREGHAWSALPVPEFLCRIGAAARDKEGSIRPTRAGLLAFGEEWAINREFYTYFIDYRQVGEIDGSPRWSDRFTSQDGLWSGNVYDGLYRIYNKLVQAIPVPFSTDGLYRVATTPAHEAVREALVNCFTNADFEGAGGIRVELSSDGIVLSNPGGFRVGIDEACVGGISDPRNKGLMKILSQIGLAERAGSGIPNMIADWEGAGFERPRLVEEVDPERSVVVLPLARAAGARTARYARSAGASSEDVAIELARTNGKVTTGMLAERLGVTAVTARKVLRGLAGEGRLVWAGTGPRDPRQRYVLP
jgi:predicted HTH transcriptional regulator